MRGSSRWTEDEIRERIGARDRLAIFSDFDGTLSPLVPTPEAARLDDGTRQILEGLARSPSIKLALISGRPLVDLASRVAIEEIYLAGSHGIEIAGPTISFVHPLAVHRTEIKREMTRSLRSAFHELPGVVVEEKPYSIACHYHGARHVRTSGIFRTIRQTLQERLRGWRVLKGRDVIEILPVEWTKGSCARLLLAHYTALDPAWESGLSVAIGDDATDEDLFRAIAPRGIRIAVGGSGRLRGDYRLPGIEEVRRLLAICGEGRGFDSRT